jgi:fumarate reductase flavoprotein subunit
VAREEEVEASAVDVAVVGAGFAGLVAAVRAQDLGARVALVEATVEAPSWSNSRVSGGNVAAAGGSPDEPAEQIAGRLLRGMGEQGDEALIRAWAEHAVRGCDWLAAHGARFVRLRGKPVMAPVRPNRGGIIWEGRGADVTLRRLHARFRERGGWFSGNTPARELLRRDGSVVGVRVESRDNGQRCEIEARAVVLADGGYAGNADLLRRYAGVARPERLVVRGPGSAVGAGIEMALAVGADFASPEAIFGHLIHAGALSNPNLAHYPILDPVVANAIVVGPDGRRFVDETLPTIQITNRLARLADPAAAWVVLDRARWQTDAHLNQAVPPNPNLLLWGARVVVADEPGTLAARMGVAPEALGETLAAVSAALAAGQGAALPVPYRGHGAPLRPPFVALPLAVGLTYTVGGPRIDRYGRVVDAARQPIPGLFAAGRAAGGLDGGPRPVSAGGLGAAIPLGLLVGTHAAQVARGLEPTPLLP